MADANTFKGAFRGIVSNKTRRQEIERLNRQQAEEGARQERIQFDESQINELRDIQGRLAGNPNIDFSSFELLEPGDSSSRKNTFDRLIETLTSRQAQIQQLRRAPGRAQTVLTRRTALT